MAFMYTLAYHDPNLIGNPYPPSVLASEWSQKIKAWLRTENSKFGPLTSSFVFDTMEELREFILENQLTDPDLIADIEAWQAVHGITYSIYLHEITSITEDIPRFINEKLG